MEVGVVPPLTFLFGALQFISNNSTLLPFPTPIPQFQFNPILPPNPITGSATPRRLRLSYVIADTELGRVRGIRQRSRDGHHYSLFRGIPYAKAPLKELRFEPPQPLDESDWAGQGQDETFDATEFRSQCLQINAFTRRVEGNEDCLYLNVATRKSYKKNEVPPLTSPDLRPVMVFIHGGLFMFGGSNMFGSKYFLDEDVVLVTLNYRLNSFGFLNSGDGVVQGNMGLRDQIQALKWIQDNIHYFNGDPRRVTLIGESAGAVCAHLHTLSPMSRGLFSGAISLSGTALSPWAQVRSRYKQWKEFSDGLGCQGGSSEEKLECLKKLPARKITRYHLGYINEAAQGKQSLFGPTVDSGRSKLKFLPKKPLELLRNGKVSDRPWISGVNSGDGLVYLLPILRNETLRKTVNSNWDTIAPLLLSYQHLPPEQQSNLTSALSSFYLHDQVGISHDHINSTGRMFSDRAFFLDSHDVAVMQSKVAPTYIFYYTYSGVFSLSNLLFHRGPLPAEVLLPSDWNYMVGTGLVWLSSMALNTGRIPGSRRTDIFHGDEMPLLFNIPLVRREVGRRDRDYKFSKKLIKLYTSFAEGGKPDPFKAEGVGEEDEDVAWPMVKGQRRRAEEDFRLERLKLDKKFQRIDEPFHERLQFWREHGVSHLPLIES